MQQFKCVFIGDAAVGKTAYLKQLYFNNFEERYIPTLGVEVHPLSLFISTEEKRRDPQNPHNLIDLIRMKKVVVNVWDCAGDSRFGGIRDGYWLIADMAIIMFDSFASFTNAVDKWMRDFTRFLATSPNASCEVKQVPIAFVWNKYNWDDSLLSEDELLEKQYIEKGCEAFKAKMGDCFRYRFFKINTEKDENLNNPINYLLREVMQDKSVLISARK